MKIQNRGQLIRNHLDTDFFNLYMTQNKYAIEAWDFLLKKTMPDTIIEFGTARGGLTCLFGFWGIINNATVHTYNNNDEYIYVEEFKKLGIKNNIKDLLLQETRDEIVKIIKNNGKTLIFCDALKPIEFAYFAPFLKSGDVITIHDYIENEEIFNKQVLGKLWDFHEVKYEDIKDTVEKNNLKPYLYKEMCNAVIGSFLKV
jgi:cephalosporin hydroxylase